MINYLSLGFGLKLFKTSECIGLFLLCLRCHRWLRICWTLGQQSRAFLLCLLIGFWLGLILSLYIELKLLASSQNLLSPSSVYLFLSQFLHLCLDILILFRQIFIIKKENYQWIEFKCLDLVFNKYLELLKNHENSILFSETCLFEFWTLRFFLNKLWIMKVSFCSFYVSYHKVQDLLPYCSKSQLLWTKIQFHPHIPPDKH